MMVTLRLYRQHDLDLITLYRHPSFSLPNAIKTALCAYVRSEQFSIKQPEPFALSDEKISKIVQIHISLSPSSEGDVIAWLKSIKEGYRNSVLKNIIRSYVCGPCVYSYMINTEEGISKALNTNASFEKNVNELLEIKGRGYKKSSIKKVDNRRVEDSELAKQILSGNNAGETKKETVFIERIADDDVDTKKLEEITKPTSNTKPVVQQEEETKPQENPEDDSFTLDDMLDDIDAMMGGI